MMTGVFITGKDFHGSTIRVEMAKRKLVFDSVRGRGRTGGGPGGQRGMMGGGRGGGRGGMMGQGQGGNRDGDWICGNP